MKTRQMAILSGKEFEKVVGSKPCFKNGFIHMPDPDWWGMLEEYLQKPVISVRKDSRKDGWDEIFVITAEGSIEEDVIHLKGGLKLVKEILEEIFVEAENDEYEVFDAYAFDDLTEEEIEELEEWLHETY